MKLSPFNFQTQTISHQGLAVNTYHWGESTNGKPPVLFLHGWLDHGASWNSTATYLNTLGYRCIAVDHRGHGHSGHIPPFEEYHFVDYISDLQSCVSALHLTEFILVGHSMGGTIASLFSAFCHPKPQALILIDGLGPKHEEPNDARHRLQLHLRQRSTLLPHRPMTLDIAHKKYARAHPYLDDVSVALEVSWLTQPHVHHPNNLEWVWDPRHRNKSAIGFDLRRFLCFIETIQCPTFSILGENSWYQQLPDLPARLQGYPNLCNNIIVPSGHSPHLECPEILAQAIDTCISTTGATHVTPS